MGTVSFQTRRPGVPAALPPIGGEPPQRLGANAQGPAERLAAARGGEELRAAGTARIPVQVATLAGAAVGSLAVGFGTMGFGGALGVLAGAFHGVVVGAAVGGVVGAALGILTSPREAHLIGRAAVAGALGGLAGAGLGGLVGSYVGTSAFNTLGFAAGALEGAAVGYTIGRRLRMRAAG